MREVALHISAAHASVAPASRAHAIGAIASHGGKSAIRSSSGLGAALRRMRIFAAAVSTSNVQVYRDAAAVGRGSRAGGLIAVAAAIVVVMVVAVVPLDLRLERLRGLVCLRGG